MNTYRVTFRTPRCEHTMLIWVLAESAQDAKDDLRSTYCHPGNEAVVISARKQKMRYGAFLRKFGKEAADEYFNQKQRVKTV